MLTFVADAPQPAMTWNPPARSADAALDQQGMLFGPQGGSLARAAAEDERRRAPQQLALAKRGERIMVDGAVPELPRQGGDGAAEAEFGLKSFEPPAGQPVATMRKAGSSTSRKVSPLLTETRGATKPAARSAPARESAAAPDCRSVMRAIRRPVGTSTRLAR